MENVDIHTFSHYEKRRKDKKRIRVGVQPSV